MCSGRSTTKQLNPHLNLVDGSLGLATTVPGMVGVEAGNVVDKDLVEVREATVEADEDATEHMIMSIGRQEYARSAACLATR